MADGINVTSTIVKFSSNLCKVKLLGVTLDTTLSVDQHINDVVRRYSYHIRALWHIRPCFDLPTSCVPCQSQTDS